MLDLAEPPNANDATCTRLARKRSIYQCILFNAGYPPRQGMQITVPVGSVALRTLYDNVPEIAQDNPASRTEDKPASTVAYYRLREGGRGSYVAAPNDAVDFWKAVRGVEWQLRDTGGIRGDGRGKFLDHIDELAQRVGWSIQQTKYTHPRIQLDLQCRGPIPLCGRFRRYRSRCVRLISAGTHRDHGSVGWSP